MGMCVSWCTLSLWCSPGYSSTAQSAVHDWLRKREYEREVWRGEVVVEGETKDSFLHSHRTFHSMAWVEMGKVMNAAVG